jgi:hypothetical protein
MQFGQLKRRKFITLLGGATIWPLASRAQQPEWVRIGVLMNTTANADREGIAEIRIEQVAGPFEFPWSIALPMISASVAETPLKITMVSAPASLS